jgi:hypothetical protein
MLEAVKPVLLEKVDIISSRFTNSGIVIALDLLNTVTILVTRPRRLSYSTITVPVTLHCLY